MASSSISTSFKDSLPRELVTHVTAMCGRRGENWFDDLPQLIAKLEVKWSLKVGDPFPRIEFNFVAAAVTSDDLPVVVKIAPPFETTEIYGEAKYLRTLGGAGAVRLLAEDRESGALLIERAMPGEVLFSEFSRNPESSIQPAIEVLRSVHRPPPADMKNVDTLDNWFKNFRRCHKTDFPQHLAQKALEIYERLSSQTRRIYYLHGDFHPGNIVTATREPYLLIDPKGIIGHIGYDIAVFVNNLSWWQKANPNVEELLQDAFSQFSIAFEIDEFELRQWAFAYMVIGAWWNFEDMPELYDPDVAMTDIWGV